MKQIIIIKIHYVVVFLILYIANRAYTTDSMLGQYLARLSLFDVVISSTGLPLLTKYSTLPFQNAKKKILRLTLYIKIT